MLRRNVPRSLLAGLACLIGLGALAQAPGATVRGHVHEALGGRPLPGAEVRLLRDSTALHATTDSSGAFRFTDVPPGMYALAAMAVGHRRQDVAELWARSGKEELVHVELAPESHTLTTHSVMALARPRTVSPLGVHSFTVEQGLRTPATFYDPARMAGTFAGTAGANDQANHLLVRGRSPLNNAWLLEGVEIVTPNHLTNAGTNSDLPVLTGGGVTILSAQMLGTSHFLTGALPLAYGNALGGVFDMRLRPGNAQRREWTAQAGLIGIDLGTEGPLGKSGRASYLVNYRYSTLGILSALGVDLGDEAITFQDLSFHVALPVGERGELRVFGMGGMSSNVFEAERDTAAWEYDKDDKDITYTARMGAVGTRLRLPLGERTHLNATVAVSESVQEREEVVIGSDLRPGFSTVAELAEQKVSAALSVERAIGTRLRVAAGATAMQRATATTFDARVQGLMLRPFAGVRYALTERLRAEAGIALAHYTFNGSQAAEPRAQLAYGMRKGRQATLAYGVRSQLPAHAIMQVHFPGATAWNERVGLTRSQDVVAGYHHTVNDKLTLRLEVYHQELMDVPQVAGSYSWPEELPPTTMVNGWDEPFRFPMTATGRATAQGAELSMDHRFANGLFYNANVSLVDSRYRTPGGTWYNTRWNTGYMANAVVGREWAKPKEGLVRTWGASLRFSLSGGQRYTPLDWQNRSGFFVPVLAGDPYSAQLATMHRVDLRIYLKRDRTRADRAGGRTGMWTLDIQNMLNTRNEAFKYFDTRKGEVVTKYQLGLIPNISYRVEF